MPWQMIYTSAPRVLTAGRSGYGTVARSASLRDALGLRLEQLSYYAHAPQEGGNNRVIHSCRLLDLRGKYYHALSRIQDAGLDFTNRTNFIAHHLVFSPEELGHVPVAPLIFRDWDGWIKTWQEEPRFLSDESWGNLYSIAKNVILPAHQWGQLTGDPANALALYDQPAGALLCADGLSDERLLSLLAETLAALEVTELGNEFHVAAWRHTFTTDLQEQDEAAGFRWRFVHSGSPVFATMASAGISPLHINQIRPASADEEPMEFVRTGPQPLRIIGQPQNQSIMQGQTVTLQVQATGIPKPKFYQWFACFRDKSKKPLIGQTGPVLYRESLDRGVHRFCVEIGNARGDRACSQVAEISVELRGKAERASTGTAARRTQPSSQELSMGLAANAARDQHIRETLWKTDENRERCRLTAAHRRIKAALSLLAILAISVGLGQWQAHRLLQQLKRFQEEIQVTATERTVAQANRLLNWLVWKSPLHAAAQKGEAFILMERKKLEIFERHADAWLNETNSIGNSTNLVDAEKLALEQVFTLLAPEYQQLRQSKMRDAEKKIEEYFDRKNQEAFVSAFNALKTNSFNGLTENDFEKVAAQMETCKRLFQLLSLESQDHFRTDLTSKEQQLETERIRRQTGHTTSDVPTNRMSPVSLPIKSEKMLTTPPRKKTP